jgi:cation transport ATPase
VPADELRSGVLTSGRGSGEEHVNVSLDGHVGGVIVMADEVRPDARDVIDRLRREGIRQLAMASGDRRSVGERVGRELGLDRVYAELSPEDMLGVVRRIRADPKLRKVLSVTAMVVGAFGYLPPVAGALLQEGIDLAVILNALRARSG